MKRVIFSLFVLLLSMQGFAQEGDSVYLFSYFINNGEDGLHLAYSEDGLSWKALNENGSFLRPEAGKDRLMRDPCIIQTPDGTFHMVWTVSWGEKGIGYAWSSDLIHWSKQQYIPVMEHEKKARNCWAPEIFYDEENEEFMIFWSTTIPGHFPETDGMGDGKNNHRMYYVTSKDMVNFSETALLYDPGFNSIDGTLLKHGSSYLMFLKDETRHPVAQKNIRVSTANAMTGPWSPASEPIYDEDWAEGPTIGRIAERWILYFDRYTADSFGAMSSTDLVHWEDISDQLSFPEGTRHGSILKVSRSVVDILRGQQSTKPNIVLFYVDDMGWQDSSEPFYSEETQLNKNYHTPQMEQLAKEGMKFTQAYACAVCSPSRISLMTGMNAARHQVTNWTLRKNKSPDPENNEITPPEWNMNGMTQGEEVPLTTKAITLPQLLNESGYRTIHVGKAHFGAIGTPGENPLNLGFDVNIAGHAAGGPGSYLGEHNFSASWRDGGHIWDVPGLEKYHGQDIFLSEALTIEANREIDRAVEDNKPFYLYLSHYAIHAPWEKDKRYFQKYLDEGLSEFEATYASMIEGMDRSLGDIMENLKQHDIWDNTIIIFMSDNGQHRNVPLNKPLRGHKLLPYEGGIRVPLIVYWPGHVSPGSVSGQYVIVEDLFPTILEMAQTESLNSVSQVVDGKSFVPYLEDTELRDEDRPLFWHFPHTYDQFPYSTVRKGDWKLIYRHLDQSLELYNLRTDLSETHNLAKEEAEIRNELASLLSDHLREVNAGMPVLTKNDKPVPYPDEVK